jgi:DNA polymerase II small subunit/DNA polymerase delta subunit B
MASFFLIQTAPGYATRVARFIGSVPGVVDVCVTSGPYDVVAQVSPVPEFQEQVRAAVRLAPGLSRLCVCNGSDRSVVASG